MKEVKRTDPVYCADHSVRGDGIPVVDTSPRREQDIQMLRRGTEPFLRESERRLRFMR